VCVICMVCSVCCVLSIEGISAACVHDSLGLNFLNISFKYELGPSV